MQAAMAQRRITSRGIVQQYLDRIAKYEDRLNAIITLNPRALDEADARDRERAQGKVRGPLHGIPIALKDNIHTTDMPTTGGALAFKGFVPPYEATLTKNLRDAGAIIIAKTNMTELANWMASGMPGNYNGARRIRLQSRTIRGPDPREARNDGRPALERRRVELGRRHCGKFLGGECRHRNVRLDSDAGQPDDARGHQADGGAYQPLRHHSDHAPIRTPPGPMARTVADAAILLGVLEGDAPDPHDRATQACPRVPNSDYTRFLNRARTRRRAHRRAARGVRRRVAGTVGCCAKRSRCFGSRAPSSSIRRPSAAAAARLSRRHGHAKGKDDNCSIVFKYGMKRDFNAWLASLGPSAPVKTLTELREVESCAPRAEVPSSMARRSSTIQMRWISRPIARAILPIARRTYA